MAGSLGTGHVQLLFFLIHLSLILLLFLTFQVEMGKGGDGRGIVLALWVLWGPIGHRSPGRYLMLILVFCEVLGDSPTGLL